MDDRLEDRKDTNEIKSIKSNKRIASSTSKPDQQESDDPRRGGKFCLERPRSMDKSGISNNHEQKNIPKDRTLDDTTHIPSGKLYPNMNAVSSIIRNLSKKGHDLISRFTNSYYREKEPGIATLPDPEEYNNNEWVLTD